MPSNMSLCSYTAGSPIRKTVIDRPSTNPMKDEEDSHAAEEGSAPQGTISSTSSHNSNAHEKLEEAKDSQPVHELDSSSELSEPPTEPSPSPVIAKAAIPAERSPPDSSPLADSDKTVVAPVRRTRAGRIVGRKRSPLPSPPKTQSRAKNRAALRTATTGISKPSRVSKRKSTKGRRPYRLKPGSLFLTQPTPPTISPITPLRPANPQTDAPLPATFYYTGAAIPRAELIHPRGVATAVDISAELADTVIPQGTPRLLASQAATQTIIDVTERIGQVTDLLAARRPVMALRDFPYPPAVWSPVQRNGKIGFHKAAISVAHVGSVDGDYELGALLREYDYRLREVEGMLFAGEGSVEVGFLEEVVGRLEERLGLLRG